MEQCQRRMPKGRKQRNSLMEEMKKQRVEKTRNEEKTAPAGPESLEVLRFRM